MNYEAWTYDELHGPVPQPEKSGMGIAETASLGMGEFAKEVNLWQAISPEPKDGITARRQEIAEETWHMSMVPQAGDMAIFAELYAEDAILEAQQDAVLEAQQQINIEADARRDPDIIHSVGIVRQTDVNRFSEWFQREAEERFGDSETIFERNAVEFGLIEEQILDEYSRIPVEDIKIEDSWLCIAALARHELKGRREAIKKVQTSVGATVIEQAVKSNQLIDPSVLVARYVLAA